MSIYAIGDLQGCYDSLQKLLETINFDESKDKLWFAGDLVNRGPQSLETLRFIKSLGKRAKVVLGNHDLALLAIAHGNQYVKKHTLDQILQAPDREELLHWLRHQKLCYHHKKRNFTLVHAGIYPVWTIEEALMYAKEVEQTLQSPNYQYFLENVFGNQPDQWHDDLKGLERLRFITNAFTRMRYCHSNRPQNPQLNFKNNGPVANETNHLEPWFKTIHRKTEQNRIIFGHWSTLLGVTHTKNTYALDTGCLWGGHLTALKVPKKNKYIDDSMLQFTKIQCP